MFDEGPLNRAIKEYVQISQMKNKLVRALCWINYVMETLFRKDYEHRLSSAFCS